VPALLSPDCGVLAEPDDVASLASAALAASILSRGACRAYAEQFCDAQRMVDEYEVLYQQLALAPDIIAHEPDAAYPLAASAA
jgi:hypothetical protein